MFQLSGLESVSASSFLLACFLPSVAVGQEDVFVDAAAFPIEFIARKSWVLIAGILVFIMHLGAARLKSGLKQSANAVNILFKNAMSICVGFLTHLNARFNSVIAQLKDIGSSGVVNVRFAVGLILRCTMGLRVDRYGGLLVDGLSQSLGLQRSDVVGSSNVDVFATVQGKFPWARKSSESITRFPHFVSAERSASTLQTDSFSLKGCFQ